MTTDAHKLALDLLETYTSEDAKQVLVDAGLWDDDTAWQTYGNQKANYGQIANQQSDPVAALVEKIVNSIDAILMLECKLYGDEPNSKSAASSMEDAVTRYLGLPWPPSKWSDREVQVMARRLSVIIGGNSKLPTIDVVDLGEGQTPANFSSTLVSLNEENKSDIRFVQGRYNMGSTGVLPFLKGFHLQLIISRRHPELEGANWGLTIVRRKEGAENHQSKFQYLKPENSILEWSIPKMKLIPTLEGRIATPLRRSVEWGTFIRMWDFDRGPRQVIWHDENTWKRRIEARLPKMPIPAYIFDCRQELSGKATPQRGLLRGSFYRNEIESSSTKAESIPLVGSVRNCKLTVEVQYHHAERVYTESNRIPHQAKYGVVFYIVNGQTHHTDDYRFFTRRKTKHLRVLAPGMMVFVDLTELKDRLGHKMDVEDLFMSGREQFRDTELREDIKSEVESLLSGSEYLRHLASLIRNRLIRSTTDVSDKNKQVLQDIMKLVNISGSDLSGRHRVIDDPTQFLPTYWKLREGGQANNYVGRIPRVIFDTDAQADYFGREDRPGDLRIYWMDGQDLIQQVQFTPDRIRKGFSLKLIDFTNPKFGEVLQFRSTLIDPYRKSTNLEPWTHDWQIEIKELPVPSSNRKLIRNILEPEIIPLNMTEWKKRGHSEQLAVYIIETKDDGISVTINTEADQLLRVSTDFDSGDTITELVDLYCIYMAIHASVLLDEYREMARHDYEIDPMNRTNEVCNLLVKSVAAQALHYLQNAS